MTPITGTITTAAIAALATGALTPAAHADVPHGRSVSDVRPFSDVTCTQHGHVVADDLIVNPGGGNVAWLPDGTLLVGTSFAMYDENGRVVFAKAYGGASRQQTSNVTCTLIGTDPD